MKLLVTSVLESVSTHLSFVYFVDDDVAYTFQRWIFDESPDYHASGTKEKTRLSTSSRLHTNLITDQLSNRHIAQLISNTLGNRYRSDSTRLRTHDRCLIPPAFAKSLFEDIGRALRCFATA
jgi:hypothetical protein